jgi:uncharacterized protein YbgA (DUF1722 family)/uncharacterized protein YbbK (DUF523 family)
MVEWCSEIRVGISSCLLGQKVRYDGQHKRDPLVTDLLAEYFTFIPACPEVEIGLGIPRETIRLEGSGDGVRLVALKSGSDHTGAMSAYSRDKAEQLAGMDLSGYILKKDSPSCGMERVKVYSGKGPPAKTGRGLFAAELILRMPLLPVEEEGRLNDPRLRENFVERVFAFKRLADFFATRWTVGDLVRFHTAEKLLLMAHDPEAYGTLGRMVAHAKGAGRENVEASYREAFMGALRNLATTRKHTNALQHMAGYFKALLPPDERRELADLVTDFRKGLVPLIVPITLIRHFVRRYEVDYLAGQTYLEPHPKELMLRNHV